LKRILIFLYLSACIPAVAQEDLLRELDTDDDDVTLTTATFKGQRLVNGQTIETIPGQDLQFIFSHRFGRLNSGMYNFFGLDDAYVRIGMEYGLSDRLGVGVGRNSVDKTLDAYLRYKILRQKEGAESFPFTATAFGGLAFQTSPRNKDLPVPLQTNDRMAYVTQVLIARKFTSALSFQIMPSVVHKNTVNKTFETNTTPLLGVGGRIKLTRSMALTSEYYYRFDVPPGSPYHNPLGFGIDIETGGHVFQLVFTNSRGLTERAFLTETLGNFFEGDIHFGFNVTRMFTFKR
jgi:hypothetical protein